MKKCLTFLKVELLSSKSVTCIKFEWAVRHVVDILIQSPFFNFQCSIFCNRKIILSKYMAIDIKTYLNIESIYFIYFSEHKLQT